MRNAFADEIFHIALSDKRVVVFSGDIGNRLFDKFKEAMPARFYNCGIAEANMISMAAGMAASGLRPVCYTITPFVTTRCLEQIKVDVCYHNIPVVIVGTGSGLSYASLGSTHHSFEDIACLRSLPGLQILVPVDARQLRTMLRWALRQDAPCYIRIGKKGEPDLLPEGETLEVGRWHQLRSGDAASLLCCGPVLAEGLNAADVLSAEGISISVWAASTAKPLDEQTLIQLSTKPVVTLEEHSILGGFGSAVAEFLSENSPGRLVKRLGIPDHFLHDCGGQKEARIHCGIHADGIAEVIRSLVATSK